MQHGLPAYAELHALSNFSFQRGASHPEELVERAHALGYAALALTDECSVAGVVRAHVAAKALGLKFIPGAEFRVSIGPGQTDLCLVVLPHDVQGWGNLCEFISAARQAGHGLSTGYRVAQGESAFDQLTHCQLLLCPLPTDGLEQGAWLAHLAWASQLWGERLWLGIELHQRLDDAWRLDTLLRLGQLAGVPCVAAGGVLMHVRSRKPLHDVMTAVALGCTVHDCGWALQANAQAHLRPRMRLAEIYLPQLLAATVEVSGRCHFSLDEIRNHYAYPQQDTVPPGHTPLQWLHQLSREGLRERYPHGAPAAVEQQVAHEMALIAELRYEMYFITVHDIVRFARSRGILCQGRGSAANSAVCYCLGITAIDPAESQLLFERFISRERLEPPDIDVDFEHQRREEIIAYIYGKYGHERAAIAATVIRYRDRSAVRDVGKALGLSSDTIEILARDPRWLDQPDVQSAELATLDPQHPGLAQWLELSRQLLGMPRHLGQHVGGFVLTQGKLTRLVPVQPASMQERFIIQWDKDDLEAVGLMKVDVLALGMLSAIRRCLDLLNSWRGSQLQMHQIPADDEPTYDMICAADTVGVFQIESRAQMGMLPRLKPRCYYDLVVQVAIVRPGPIQGGMVHPYLERRQMQRRAAGSVLEGAQRLASASPFSQVRDPVSTFSFGEGLRWGQAELEPALGRTLGVPIFQEQVMQIAMIAADFTAGEADQLRRAMAAWKRKGGLEAFRQRLIGRMVDKGYDPDFAQRIFSQIEGFGEYGFPESHAASFAKLVYVSCWLKRHEPACFLAAMLNSQPLGFYSPSQLVQDARRHKVCVRPVDVTLSQWDCSLEPSEPPAAQPAVRLGLRMVAHLSQAAVCRIEQARRVAPFASTEDLARRADLGRRDLDALAAADALASLAGHRRQQTWAAVALHSPPPLLRQVPVHEPALELPPMPEGQDIASDYRALGLSLRRHPLALLRPRLAQRGLLAAGQLDALPGGRRLAACGIVTVRQQPSTVRGVMFITLEDETGSVNVIVGRPLRQRQRSELLYSRLLAVWGLWQRMGEPGQPDGHGPVRNLVAHHLEDLSPLLGDLVVGSRDFH